MIRQVGSAMVAVLVAASCGNPAEFETVAGEYRMTRLVIADDGPARDFFALGVRATLILHSDGTTEGSFTAPAIVGEEEDTPFDLDLVGSYRVQGDSIFIDQEADTFLKDAPLLLDRGRLRTTDPGTDAVFERR